MTTGEKYGAVQRLAAKRLNAHMKRLARRSRNPAPTQAELKAAQHALGIRVGPILNPSKSTRLLLKTGGVCAYCATRLTLETMTVDHRIPKIRGGSNLFGNLVPACQPCNTRKGSDLPDLWPIHERAKP